MLFPLQLDGLPTGQADGQGFATGLPLHFKGGGGPLHCFIFQTSCVVRRGAAIHQTDAKRLFTSISAPPLFARDFCELGSRNLAFKVPQVFPGLILLPQEHISLNEATIAINARDSVHFLFRERIGGNGAKIT